MMLSKTKMMLFKAMCGSVFAGALTLAMPALAETPAAAPKSPPMMMMKKSAAKPAPLDINSASKNELQALKGVGEKRADDIIKGRPYKGKDDLVAKKILPQGVYDGIKDKIVAKQK